MTIIQHIFIVHLDYGNREHERKFVAEVLDSFDKDTLCGANLFINNNPYGLELLLSLNFEKDGDKFENWLKEKHPTKRREYRLQHDDIADSVFRKSYSVVGLLNSDLLPTVMPSETNGLFLFPDRKVMSAIWPRPNPASTFSVFLSHSSRDKSLVYHVFNELHKAEVRSWYDRYEIEPGDSITDKINEGLRNSKLGLLFLSRNFLDPASGWPTREANYFFQKLMRTGQRNFIVLNIDLSIDELPPLLQDYRFVDMKSPSAVAEVVQQIKQQSLA
jgi:hypothetical protein